MKRNIRPLSSLAYCFPLSQLTKPSRKPRPPPTSPSLLKLVISLSIFLSSSALGNGLMGPKLISALNKKNFEVNSQRIKI